MREIRTERTIAASSREVWHVLCDFERYPEWNPFIRSVRGEPAQGVRLKVRIQPPGRRAMTFTPQVLEVQPERRLRWLGHLLVRGLLDGEHIFEIEQLETDAVRFVQRERFEGLLVPLLWRFLQPATKAGFEAMNEALAQRVQAHDSDEN